MRNGERPKQQRVDQTENQRIRADADSQQQSGGDGKYRALGEQAQAEAEIAQELGHRHFKDTSVDKSWNNAAALTFPLSAVSLASIADASDLNTVLVLEIEEYAVVAAAEPEAGKRRLELFQS